MALEPGGYADKLGNRYEGRWIARQLLFLLAEQIKSVQIEAVGNDEHGVDLWVVQNDDIRVAQQCKLRNRHTNSWSPADLQSRGVLDHARSQLERDPTCVFHLVTALPSATLEGLCRSARNSSGDPQSYYEHQVKAVGHERQRVFDDICNRLGLSVDNSADLAMAYDFVRRFEINTWPDSSATREELRALAFYWVDGAPDIVLAALCEFANTHLRRVINAPMLREYLSRSELHPRRLDHDPRVATAIDSLRERFHDSISDHLINGSLIQRRESAAALDALNDNPVVLLLGEPGNGKSGVLFELVTKLNESGAVYLPVRLDRQPPSGSTRRFGQSLGLPESPVRCLRAIAGDRRGVLILDQLDALRWTANHSREAMDVCRDLLREVRGIRQQGADICVVMACRSYDRKHDPEIRNWLDGNKGLWSIAEIAVKGLSPDEVRGVIADAGISAPKFTDKQHTLLASPQNLSLWLDLAREGTVGTFTNRAHLHRKHWELKQCELSRLGTDPSDISHAISRIVSYMESHSSHTAPASLLENLTRDRFLAAGILDCSGTQLSFSHQSQLDYQVASRVLSELHTSDTTLLDWLGPRDEQTLFRREQLRYALSLLADEDEPSFREAVASLLDSEDVRFHLKHLCLEVSGQLATPSQPLVSDMLSRRDSPSWTDHIDSTVFWGHPPFIERLLDMHVLQRWLADEAHRNKAFWLLRSVAEAIPDAVTRVLAPYAEHPDLRELVLGSLAWNAEDDSDEMFALRLRLARDGIYKDFVNWKALIPCRRLALLEAVLTSMEPDDLGSSLSQRAGGHRSRIDHWSPEDLEALLGAAHEHPAKTWSVALEAINRLAPGQDSKKYVLTEWLDPDRRGLRQGLEDLPQGLVRIAIEAGRSLARADSENFWNGTATFRESRSPIILNILAASFVALDMALSEAVITWLLEDPHRFELGTGESEPKWLPAHRLIEAHERSSSDALFARLETAIINFRPRSLIQNAGYWLSTWKEDNFGDYWGRCQYFLLAALPSERRSAGATGLLGVLERKYTDYDESRFISGGKIFVGTVGSKLGSHGDRISDASWLQIVANQELKDDRNGSRLQIADDHVVESSIHHFSRTLREAAKRQPDRFARLSLRFPEGVQSSYVSSVLDVLRLTSPDGVPQDQLNDWEPVACDIAERVLTRYTDLSDREMAIAFCWLLHDRAGEPWSIEILDRLIELVKSHEDPEPNHLVCGIEGTNSFDAQESTPSNLDNNSLNCVRAVATLAVGMLLREHQGHLERLVPALESACADDHPAVRTAAVTACLSVLPLDKDLAMRLFVRACSTDPRVTATRHAVYFFNSGMTTHAELLSPLVNAMLKADSPEVARKGAREVAARWLFHGHFEEELALCQGGAETLRLGVANIMAKFVSDSEYNTKALPLARQFLSDPSLEVRAAARGFDRNGDVLSTEHGRSFISDIIASPAFVDDPTHVLYAMDDHPGSLVPFADIILAAASRFAGDLADASRDMSRSIGLDADKIGRLLLRLYEEVETQSPNDTRSGCLDAWDALLQKRVGVRNLFEE